MRQQLLHVILIGVCFVPISVPAENITMVVGGGPTPAGTQSSIELNVQWLVRLLDNQPGQFQLFFNRGDHRLRDVYRVQAPTEFTERYAPLARVFGEHWANRDRYYTNRIDYPAESTQADALLNAMQETSQQMQAGDTLFFVFNGHGLGHSDYRDNTFALWNNTNISVSQLEAAVDDMPEQTTLRYFMPQCYSGGFNRLAYRHADPDKGLSKQTRCGFMSVPPDRPAEGCTPSVNTDDFRDYTTYFFSALSGKTRDDGPLAVDPDFDGNGAVSLLEAHYYSMIYAESADLPRTTSEQYLLNQRPWFYRWARGRTTPDNVYADITQQLARRLNIDIPWHRLAPITLKTIDALQTGLTEVKKKRDRLIGKQSSLQHALQDRLFIRWPHLRTPYTSGYTETLEQIGAINEFISEHEDYAELVSLQSDIAGAESAILALQRQTGEYLRLRRLHELASALHQFNAAADADERAAFERLRACEQWEPNLKPAGGNPQ